MLHIRQNLRIRARWLRKQEFDAAKTYAEAQNSPATSQKPVVEPSIPAARPIRAFAAGLANKLRRGTESP
jgi:hypothetical protein